VVFSDKIDQRNDQAMILAVTSTQRQTHRSRFRVATALIIAVLLGTAAGYSQNWSLGGTAGLSLLGGSAGFVFTPTAELKFNRAMAVGSEFSINTHQGAPLLWHPYFRYYFDIRRSKFRPYANAGPVLLLNIPNAPYFGILFGGGVNIPLTHGLFLAPDVQIGPIFAVGAGTYPYAYRPFYWGYQTSGLGPVWVGQYSSTGETIFAFSVRVGVRYEI
jgi:hypothetical protein